MNTAPNLIRPGKDAIEHDTALQGNIAQVLEVPASQVIPTQDQVPDVDQWEDLKETIHAHLPEDISNKGKVRIVSNSTSDKKGILDILKDKLRKKSSREENSELKEAA